MTKTTKKPEPMGEHCEDCFCHLNPSGFCVGCVNKWLWEAEEKGRIDEGIKIMRDILQKQKRQPDEILRANW